ncbi:hypothetical protein CONSTELLA_108 [Mycobacterium phage Constella]|nr:hypothetical protein CONSTELLA_108 [Mycobacterium phage Constella]
MKHKQTALKHWSGEVMVDEGIATLIEKLWGRGVITEELAAIRQHTEVSRADLELHLRWYTTAPGAYGVSPEVVAQSLLDSYRITPR